MMGGGVVRSILAVFTACLLWVSADAWPDEVAVKVDVDTRGLVRTRDARADENPFRGNARAVAVGEVAFHQACARCHALADSGGIGPDLRLLNAYCRRIADATLKRACLGDQDHYFLKTVLEGKTIVGVTHMPAWRDFLSEEGVWAIRTYIESKEIR